MPIKQPGDPSSNEITDEGSFLNRRNFIRAGILAASAAATALVYRRLATPERAGQSSAQLTPPLENFAPASQPSASPSTQPAPASPDMSAAYRTNERKNTFDEITHYNNYYEFSTDKDSVAEAAKNFVARPWTVEVGGLVSKPKVFDIDDLLKISPAEERVYRMRCVEAWSMVIPWDGFSLSKLLDRVQPLSSAKYVAFQTLVDKNRMPGLDSGGLNWPYVEGLRMDEAMHPLTILASGIYGRQIPAQNGAPVRLVIPWKYGFKGIKSIVKIELRADQPPTTWSGAAPNEYGFYANVNPEVDHPRWSQAQERRILTNGDFEMRPTLKFNGYGEQVASLYAGMDLRQNF
jgi:sulfoxide reductase catalytic subunit YedY